MLRESLPLVTAIFEWRTMKYVHEQTKDGDVPDAILNSPGLFHWMTVLDVGEEEALEMRRESAGPEH